MINKRMLLAAAGSVLVAVGMGSPVQAQTFTKPVRIVVPFAPGGTSDILARLIAPKLQEAIGQPVIVENKPGAGGNIGADIVAKADKDGHTILLMDVATLAIAPALQANPTYHPTKDLAPVGMILFAPYILATHPSVPVKTVAELIAYIKANPGKLAFSNPGIGAANHIAALQLAKSWGGEVKHIPYKGGADAIKGVIAGESHIILNGATATSSFVAQGQLKGLAVTGDARVEQVRDLPTFSELKLAATDSGTWQGILATAGSPPALITRLNTELNKILAMPDIAKRIVDLGGQQKAGKPEDMKTWLETSTTAYAGIIKEAGIKAQ